MVPAIWIIIFPEDPKTLTTLYDDDEDPRGSYETKAPALHSRGRMNIETIFPIVVRLEIRMNMISHVYVRLSDLTRVNNIAPTRDRFDQESKRS